MISDFVCRVYQRDADDERWTTRATYGGDEGPAIKAESHYRAAEQAVRAALDHGHLDATPDRRVSVLVQNPAGEWRPTGYEVPLVLTVGAPSDLDSDATGKLAGKDGAYDGWTAHAEAV